MTKKTICIDIDGTLIRYEDWQGENHFGQLLPGASDAMKKLHEEGWFIIIYSTRANKGILEKFLHKNDLEFDSINENPFQPDNAKGGKPLADVYVDDRALCFKGNWEQTLREIFSFKPWEEMENIDKDVFQHSKQLLINGFQQAFYMLRHYDEVNWNLTKFAFGQILVSLVLVGQYFLRQTKLPLCRY